MEYIKKVTGLKAPSFGIVLLMLFFAPAVASFYFGVQPHVVSSASMQPEINPGDVILTRLIKVSEVKRGEVILLFDNKVQAVQAHRVINVLHDLGTSDITTKGDSNPLEDKLISEPSNQLLQKVVLVVPNVGHVLEATHSSSAKYLGGFGLLSIFVIRMIQRVRISKSKNEEKITATKSESKEMII